MWAFAWPTVLILGLLVGTRPPRAGADRARLSRRAGDHLRHRRASRHAAASPMFGVTVPGFVQPAVIWAVERRAVGCSCCCSSTARSDRSARWCCCSCSSCCSAATSRSTLMPFESVRDAVDDASPSRCNIDGGAILWIVQRDRNAGRGLAGMALRRLAARPLRGQAIQRTAADRRRDLAVAGARCWRPACSGSRRPLAALAAALPWIAWRLTLHAALHPILKSARARPPMRLLLLRVYGFGRRSRRLLDLLGTRWRLLGSIDLIAAPDLASRTVEPSTFLEFVRGRLKRLFIRSPGRSAAAHRQHRRPSRSRCAVSHQPAVLLRRHVEGRRHALDGDGIAGRHGPARIRSAPPRLRLRAARRCSTPCRSTGWCS